MTRKSIQYLGAASALAMAVSLACAGGAAAQVTTATIRGSVTDDGVAEAGATIVARDTASGFTSRSTANANGAYVLSGLRPGTYEVTVTTADGETASDIVSIGVGQVGDLDLAVGGDVVVAGADPDAAELGDVIVTGRRLVEVRTPENATNVTTQQINTLPQINRNFLNFAALAPGVRLSSTPEEQQITAGGQRAESVNAFIDGASLKSNVIAGGIIGQDDSRGNPFPQAGIQEFRVVSQNFKAEYEQASSAIITAVTRSGTNEFHGEIFGVYRDQDFVAQDFFTAPGTPRIDLEVQQYGFALGGPIIRDRLHFFGTYEHKQENRANVVDLGDRATLADVAQFAPFIGTFAAPFEEDLFFGKLSWQAAQDHLVDWSITYRDESELRDFGGAESFERANDLAQTTVSSNLRWQWRADAFLNEFAIDYRDYHYNPGAANFSDIGRSYRRFEDSNTNTPAFDPDYFGGFTILNTGGRDSTQDISDNALTFRNDLTFNDIELNGFHTIKMGAKISLQNYQVNKQFGRNPFFFYDLAGRPELSGSADVPYRVELGRSFPSVDLDNEVIGLYIQDDWQLTDQLELNLGLRWDYETNANNNDYVTPASVIAGLDQWIASTDGGKPAGYAPSWFDRSDYISTGNNRDPFAGAFQPRIGFSYDVFGDNRTVIFGGAGRYYDRINFNFSYDEIVKPFDIRQNAFFSTTGRPVGQDADPGPGVDLPGEAGDPILWQASYGTAAGLDPVFATIPGKGEVFLLANDFEPPRTDQFNLGLRQRFGDWQSEFTLAYGRTENEFTWQYLTRCREPNRPNDGGGFGDNGGFCGPGGSNPYRGYFVSDHNKEREFRALYVKLDRPYTRESGWGLNLAYTWSEAEQNGGRDAFCFDCFSIETSPVRPTDNDERHRIVANGIVDLPLGFQLSGILTLGSGTPFDVFDGRGASFYYRPNHGRPQQYNFIVPNSWAYRNLDLRLTKNFEFIPGQELSIYLDAINVFNFDNFAGFDGGTGSLANPNPNFERPSRVLFPTRTFQVGMRYSF